MVRICFLFSTGNGDEANYLDWSDVWNPDDDMCFSKTRLVMFIVVLNVLYFFLEGVSHE